MVGILQVQRNKGEITMKLYLVVIEDQKECYDEHTAQISDVAYKDLDKAKKAFYEAINEVENNADDWWVAEDWNNNTIVSVVKETLSDRMVEYYDKYGASKLYVYIHEVEVV